MSTWKLTKKLKETHLSAFSKNTANNVPTSSSTSTLNTNTTPSSSHIQLPTVTAGTRRSDDLAHQDTLSRTSTASRSTEDTTSGSQNNTIVAPKPIDSNGITSTAISPGCLSVSISKATGISLPPGYSWPQSFLDIGKNSTSDHSHSKGASLNDRNSKSVAGSLTTDRQTKIASSKKTPPIYIVLEFDKMQVIVDADGGTVDSPIFDKTSNFDMSRPEPLSIQLFAKVPIYHDHSTSYGGLSPFTPPAVGSSVNSSGQSHDAGASVAKSRVVSSGSEEKKDSSHLIQRRKKFQEVFLGSCKIENDKKLLSQGFSDSVRLSSGTGTVTISIDFKPSKTKKHLTIDDFELLKVIGKGSFGKVMQVKKIDTQRVYAVKTIRKAHIVSRSEVNHTLAERTVLAQIDNPFIVPLKFSFQSREKLYLVLAFVNGGELFHHLQREGRFDLNRSRFYTAELLCALECLHQYNVIYRDLKPENILLDYTGHIALCDFGLCKLNMENQDKTNTFCGTPEYLAPELLLGKGYTKVVDWWTLGVLFYEMLTGLPPFYDQDTNEMYRKILRDPLRFPDDMDREARSLLTGLLDRDPCKRLGINGAAEIKAHPFFAQIDWRRLMNKKYAAPYKPSVESATDTSNFDQEFTSEEPTDSVVDKDCYLSESVQKQFGGWTYVNTDNKLASSGRW